MKKYISRATKSLAILTLISAVIFAVGIILIIADFSDIALQIGLTSFGSLMSIIFITCFFAEKSRALIIDANKIILPRGVDKNGKTVFQKTVIMMDEIRSVESKFNKGDKFIFGDCFFYILRLRDGTNVTVTLYSYGKKAEKEILEIIQNSIA